MFTWICPQCGREVPPAYDACPDCAAREKAGGQPTATATQAPPTAPQSAPAAPPAYAPPAVAPPAYAAPAAAPLPPAQYAPPPPHSGLPTWLLAILFAFAFVGMGAGVYWTINYFRNGTQAASAPAAVAAKSQGKPSPFQKYVEVSGIRFVESPQHAVEARFLVINHSDADLADLAGTVNIWGRTAKAEEEAAGSFSFKIAALEPNQSKEVVAPLTTKLKPYELPDWQNLVTQVQITSPQ